MAEHKNISAETKLRLFSASAGHCQRPECLKALFPQEMGGDKHIAEMAHVIPRGLTGPRHEERPEEDFDPNTFDNLILLCPTCHTIIDKDPGAYSRNLLLGWKQTHLTNLAHRQGIKAYDSRDDARKAVASRMAENKAIWKKFAPVDGTAFECDPESQAAQIWLQRVRGVILPNHYLIQSIIEANLHLATDAEQSAFAEYREHVRGLSERHICGVAGNGIRFPWELESIFT